MRRAALTLVILAACGDDGAVGATAVADGSATDSMVTTPTIEPATDTLADDTSTTASDGPSGPCPLVGMFVECSADGADGLAYCGLIDDTMQWGPCLTERACELGDSATGCQRCTLEEGVPTLVGSAECVCEGSDDLPVCEQTECLQRWEYRCDDCETFTAGDCLSYDLGCASPRLGCAQGPSAPCDRVWAFGDVALDQLEDEAAAICMLTALRDGVVGTFEVGWGEMSDAGSVSQRVYAGGEGTVVFEWSFDCEGCQLSGSLGRSGAVMLQPAEWFDACLTEPTTASLIACTIELSEYTGGDPPPGYAPPFTTGECASLEAACP